MEQPEQNINSAVLSDERTTPQKNSKSWSWIIIGCGIFTIIGVLIVAIVLIGIYFYARSAEQKNKPVSTNDQNKYSNWQSVEYTADEFTAKFPDKPIIENIDNEHSNSNMYTVEDSNGSLYAIIVSKYKYDLSANGIGPVEILENMVKLKPEYKIVEYEKITNSQDVLLGVKYLVTSDNIMFQRGYIFIVDNTLYLIALSYKNENFDEKNFKYFISNFQLLE